MNVIQHLVIAIGVLVILLAIIGVSVSSLLKGNALPKWAKFNPSDSWGFVWIDKKRWQNSSGSNSDNNIFYQRHLASHKSHVQICIFRC